MARIFGVDLPKNKRILVGLTYLYGVGRSRSAEILSAVGIDPSLRTDSLTDDDVAKIRAAIESSGKVEGDLRRDVHSSIKRLMELGTYRGLRHRKGLPVRGQRTRTNSRTRKGPRKLAVAGKKAPGKK